jgi:hypothetical protein
MPERGEFHHHGLLYCGPDSGRGGCMNFTSNEEEPMDLRAKYCALQYLNKLRELKINLSNIRTIC